MLRRFSHSLYVVVASSRELLLGESSVEQDTSQGATFYYKTASIDAFAICSMIRRNSKIFLNSEQHLIWAQQPNMGACNWVTVSTNSQQYLFKLRNFTFLMIGYYDSNLVFVPGLILKFRWPFVSHLPLYCFLSKSIILPGLSSDGRLHLYLCLRNESAIRTIILPLLERLVCLIHIQNIGPKDVGSARVNSGFIALAQKLTHQHSIGGTRRRKFTCHLTLMPSSSVA